MSIPSRFNAVASCSHGPARRRSPPEPVFSSSPIYFARKELIAAGLIARAEGHQRRHQGAPPTEQSAMQRWPGQQRKRRELLGGRQAILNAAYSAHAVVVLDEH
jgi:hypothetical protein